MNHKPLPLAAQSPRLARTPYRVHSPFTRVVDALRERGHRPVPLAPGKKYPGEYLGRSRGWITMKGWNKYCDIQPTDNEIGLWSRWPDANVGVVFHAGFIAIDFDEDVGDCHAEIQTLLAELPGVVVKRRGAKGYQQYFRAEGVKTRVYPNADKRNMLEVLAHGRQGVAAPSIHPDTGREYGYLSYRELTDTSVEDLPLITAEVIGQIEDILRARGWCEPPKRREQDHGQDYDASAEDDLWDRTNGYAFANLPAWVEDLGLRRCQQTGEGYRAVPSFRPSKSGKAESDRSRNLSIHPSGITDWSAGKGYTPISLVMAALSLDFGNAWRWLYDRVAPAGRELPEIEGDWGYPAPANDNPVIPPHDAVQALPQFDSVENARRVVSKALDDFFDNTVPAQLRIRDEIEWIEGRYNRNEATGEECSAALARSMGILMLHVTTGVGKTSAAIPRIIAAARKGLGIVVSLPEHTKCAEFVKDLDKAGCDVPVSVWRGFREAGCKRLEEAESLQSIGLGVERHLCNAHDPENGTGVGCRFAKTCPYAQQLETESRIWVVPHSTLYTRPKTKFDTDRNGHDILVVDEDPFGDAVRLPKEGRPLASFNILPGQLTWQGTLLKEGDAPHEESEIARKIVAALADHIPPVDDGYPPHNWHQEFYGNCNLFQKQGVQSGELCTLITYLNGLESVTKQLPDGPLKTTTAQAASKQRHIKRWKALAEIILDVIDGEVRESGRMWLRATSDGAYIYAAMVKTLDPTWTQRIPMAMLDATPAPRLLVEKGSGRKIDTYVRAAACNAKDVTFTQIKGAPVRKKHLSDGGKAVEAIDAFVKGAAAAIGPTLQVLYKAAYEHTEKQEGVDRVSSGRVRGSNAYEHHNGVIVAHSAGQGMRHAEQMVGAITGTMPPRHDPPPVTGNSHKTPRVEKQKVLCRARSGSYFLAEQQQALTSEAEEFYRYQADSTLDQIVGRVRAVNRKGRPAVVIVFSDEPLPFEVDVVLSWHQAATMGGAGVVRAYAPDVKPGLAVRDTISLKESPGFEGVLLARFSHRQLVLIRGETGFGSRAVVRSLRPHGVVAAVCGVLLVR